MAHRPRGTPVDTRTLRRLAVTADTDERTVARYLLGERIRTASVRERIVMACASMGLIPAAPRPVGPSTPPEVA